MRAVFLDRDGVINRKPAEGTYVTRWDDFELLQGASQAIRRLNEAGFLVIVVTNQRCVARGLLTEQDLNAIHSRLAGVLEAGGGSLDAIYYCPHEIGACDCRKPLTGMFEMGRRDFPQLEFSHSFVVGDSPTDVEAGKRIGARTILIEEGSAAALPPDCAPFARAPSLLDAVTAHILAP